MSFSGARVIALDLGEKRVGIAVSDPLGITAQGLATWQRRNRAQDFAHLTELALTYEAGLWLIGLPIELSGREGRQAVLVREFGAKLGGTTRIPVEYLDERLTTVEASRVLKEAGASRNQFKRAVDRLSAVVLLQSYLDRRQLASGEAFDRDR